MAISVDELIEVMESVGLVEAKDLEGLCEKAGRVLGELDAKDLLRVLVKAKVLTRFQANALINEQMKFLKIGEYVVLDKIGSGGMGDVYKARHRYMDRVVAVKLLPKAAAKDEIKVKRFYREVKVAAKLVHPNIVTAYDAGLHGKTHFLTMEYVSGKDLSRLVHESGPFVLGEALEYARQAAVGLGYAHEQGVVHRDIKPANLLLDQKGVVKVLDLGLARLESGSGEKAEQSLTVEASLMGTLEYMPPEQALNVKAADARSDVYALGCTFYRIATGLLPFRGQTMAEKIVAHREQAIPQLRDSLPGCPAKLQGVFEKMVAKAPEDRYQTMDEVAKELSICAMMLGDEGAGDELLGEGLGDRFSEESESGLTLGGADEGQSVMARLAAAGIEVGSTTVRPSGEKKGKKSGVLIAGGVCLLVGVLGWVMFGGGGGEEVEGEGGAEVARVVGDGQVGDGVKSGLPEVVEVVEKLPVIEAVDAGVMEEPVVEVVSVEPEVVTLPEVMVEEEIEEVMEVEKGKQLAPIDWPLVRRVSEDGKYGFVGQQVLDVPEGFSSIQRQALYVDGERAVAAISMDGGQTLELWDLNTHEQLFVFDKFSKPMTKWIISPSGDLLVILLADNRVMVWDIEGGEQVALIRTAHEGAVRSALVSGDDGRLVTCGGNQVKLWDLRSGNLLSSIGQSSRIEFLAFSEDGLFVGGGMLDGSVGIWEVVDDTLVVRQVIREQGVKVRSVTFASGGKYFVVALSDGGVRWWDTETGELVNHVFLLAGSSQPKFVFELQDSLAFVKGGSICRSDRGEVLTLLRFPFGEHPLVAISSNSEAILGLDRRNEKLYLWRLEGEGAEMFAEPEFLPNPALDLFDKKYADRIKLVGESKEVDDDLYQARLMLNAAMRPGVDRDYFVQLCIGVQSLAYQKAGGYPIAYEAMRLLEERLPELRAVARSRMSGITDLQYKTYNGEGEFQQVALRSLLDLMRGENFDMRSGYSGGGRVGAKEYSALRTLAQEAGSTRLEDFDAAYELALLISETYDEYISNAKGEAMGLIETLKIDPSATHVANDLVWMCLVDLNSLRGAITYVGYADDAKLIEVVRLRQVGEEDLTGAECLKLATMHKRWGEEAQDISGLKRSHFIVAYRWLTMAVEEGRAGALKRSDMASLFEEIEGVLDGLNPMKLLPSEEELARSLTGRVADGAGRWVKYKLKAGDVGEKEGVAFNGDELSLTRSGVVLPWPLSYDTKFRGMGQMNDCSHVSMVIRDSDSRWPSVGATLAFRLYRSNEIVLHEYDRGELIDNLRVPIPELASGTFRFVESVVVGKKITVGIDGQQYISTLADRLGYGYSLLQGINDTEDVMGTGRWKDVELEVYVPNRTAKQVAAMLREPVVRK